MRTIYLIVLNFIAGLAIRKNNFCKNYFNPKGKEAQNIYKNISCLS